MVVDYPSLDYEQDWFQAPPYADGGGGIAGENPTISVTEFYLTPFDRFVWNSPEESRVSELYTGKVIGFGFLIADYDPGEAIAGFFLGTRGSGAGTYVDGMLLGPGGVFPEDTAVENVTWGRIKAAFGK